MSSLWRCHEFTPYAVRDEKARVHIDYHIGRGRGLDKAMLRDLATGRWIESKLNVILVGRTGVGKSYLAAALTHAACRQGRRALYARVPRIVHDLAIARADGTYTTLLARLARIDVLVLDDFLLAPMKDSELRDLLEILEDRYDRTSTVINSQVPTKRWHELLADPTLADAICDRLVHNAHLIALQGPSMREKKGPPGRQAHHHPLNTHRFTNPPPHRPPRTNSTRRSAPMRPSGPERLPRSRAERVPKSTGIRKLVVAAVDGGRGVEMHAEGGLGGRPAHVLNHRAREALRDRGQQRLVVAQPHGQRPREGQYPLSIAHLWQHVVHQQRRALGHSPAHARAREGDHGVRREGERIFPA